MKMFVVGKYLQESAHHERLHERRTAPGGQLLEIGDVESILD